MTLVQAVAIAGAGRIGGPIVEALLDAGFTVTVLTRDESRLANKWSAANILEVDYDLDRSLQQALEKQDALVSAVAIAIGNQKKMIDAAVAAGVGVFIPAEYTANSRDPNAQVQPMMATDIQQYLAGKEDKIMWFVVNCGALLEFVLDHPILLDFDNHEATLWDGGERAISLSDIPLLARVVTAALRTPEKAVDHRVKVHGGSVTQNRALELAKQHSTQASSARYVPSQEAYAGAMDGLARSGGDQAELMRNLMTAYAAATFGSCDGHFESAYSSPDNA